MRLFHFLCAATVAAASVQAFAAPAEPASDLKAKFNVSRQTEVPGMTLQPGSYSIRVVDHLADRLIVRIDGSAGGAHSTFIGLPNSDLPAAGGTGIIAFDANADGGAAARGFSFPGGKTVEFVYPKAEAVSLAKANGTKVVAIDPASEGRVPTSSGLSKDDMEVVTLWTLSSTKVGPGDAAPAISAAKYQAPPSDQVASVTRKPRPVIAKLPHTGSDLPLIALFAMLALFGGLGLRYSRLRSSLSR